MMIIKLKIKSNIGFSLIEAILSLAIFMLVVTGVIAALTYGVQSPQVAGAHSRALLLAEEGLEAARNLRDSSYAGLTVGTSGLTPVSGAWTLSGVADSVGIFYRHLDVASVDANRKIVTSTVSYSTKPGVTSTVSIATYITNWRRVVATLGGLIVYGDSTTSTKFRNYDTTLNSFDLENSISSNAIGQTFIVRTSPNGREAIAGYVTSAGVLNIMCYDGNSWLQDWTVTVGGDGSTRRFDIAYETGSGDAMVLYSNNALNTNELAYRTKLASAGGCGSANWSIANNLTATRTNGVVHWVKMAWDRRVGQDLITAIWADSAADLSAMVWSGSAWGNEPTAVTEASLEVVSVAQDVEDFDVEYESVTGDVMVVWANSSGNNGVNGVRNRLCTGGIANCTWSAIMALPTFRDDATNLDISANPNTDEIVFASIGNAGSDLQIGYWSGTAWTNTQNSDTSCGTPTAGSKLVATGWVISGGTSRSIVRYSDQGSTALNWYVGTNGSFVKQTDWIQSPLPTGPIYYDIQMNPLSQDQLMSLLSDGTNHLLAKRLVFTAPATFTWTNSEGGVELTTTLSQSINNPFSFAYWRI